MRAYLLLCAVAPTFAAQELTIHGSNTVGENLAPALVQAWLEHAGLPVETNRLVAPQEREMVGANGADRVAVAVASHGSSTGFRSVLAGDADIAMSSRPIRDAEARAFHEIGGFDPVRNEFVVALDGIAVIVHAGNPIRQLSRETLAAVFAGEITQWSQVGHPEARLIRTRGTTIRERSTHFARW